MTNILIVISSTYDLFMLTAILKEDLKYVNTTIILPNNIISNLPNNILNLYKNIYSYDKNLKTLFSVSAIKNTLNLIQLCKFLKKTKKFKTIFFGAYRDTVTSIVTKQFYGDTRFVAIKQGIEIPKNRYKRIFSLNIFHNKIYFKIFGYSPFIKERILNKDNYKNDHFLTRDNWKNNPFKLEDVYTIGSKNNLLSDGYPIISPNLKLLRKNNKEQKKINNILIIGERTPISESWGKTETRKYTRILNLLRQKYNNPKFFLRPRLNLTKNNFYSFIDPIILDPRQLFDDQLIKLNPTLVISIKSTASKVAAYYGYNSILLYRCFNLNQSELFHLDYLFGDGSPVEFIENINQIKDLSYRNFLKKSKLGQPLKNFKKYL